MEKGTRSPKFMYWKAKYPWRVWKSTLRRLVPLGEITAAEYGEITGEEYGAQRD